MSLTFYERLYRYGAWANRETLASLLNHGATPRAVAWMAHIIAAEWLWLGRVQRIDTGAPVWPSWSLEECQMKLEEVIRRWEACMSAFTDDTLLETCSYTNSKGERFTSPVADILMHLSIHGGYHRGQIAAEVRAAGQNPAYTDFIHASRQGMIS